MFLPGIVLAGPRDARIMYGDPGIAPVSPNAFGDFVTTPDTPQFDAVHTFAVVRQTLTMYQRALAGGGGETPLPWQWNSSIDTAPLQVFPHGLPNTMNAFYSRSQCCLKFGDFIPSGAGRARVHLPLVRHRRRTKPATRCSTASSPTGCWPTTRRRPAACTKRSAT